MQKVYAGIDDGYDETDSVTSLGDTYRMPTTAKAGEPNQVKLGTKKLKTRGYRTSEGVYVVGDMDDPDSTASDQYPLSAMNRCIVTHSLMNLGLTDQHHIVLATGLPVKRFYRGGKVNQELVKAKRNNLMMNDVETLDGEGVPTVIKHYPIAESIAAWFDIVSYRNDQGAIVMDEDLASQRMALVDIGGRTTDVAFIADGALSMEKSTTIDIGMINIKDAISERIYTSEDVKPSITQLNSIVHNGTARLYGETCDFNDVFREEAQTVLTRIETEIRRVLHKGADVDSVVFVGGTSAALSEFLKDWFRNQIHADDPSMANAKGMCAYAEYCDLQKK